MAFDPAAHLTKVGTSDYLEVKWRVAWLRDEHRNARIETELVERGPNWALFKATVTLPYVESDDGKLKMAGGFATGYGFEDVADFNDFIEKAETKAVGRALNHLGYGTQFAQSDDAIVDAPVERKPVKVTKTQEYDRPGHTGIVIVATETKKPPGPASADKNERDAIANSAPSTRPQHVLIRKLLSEKFDKDEQAAYAFVKEHAPRGATHGTEVHLTPLSMTEASALISKLGPVRT